MPNIRHRLTIDADPSRVFAAVTEREGLAGWWTTETVAEPRIGALLEFKFGDRYHNRMELTALEPDRQVEWLCRGGDREWVGTRITFALEDAGGRTVLRFGQLDWRDETDFYAQCNTTWAHYLHSLKAFCETGQGTPFGG